MFSARASARSDTGAPGRYLRLRSASSARDGVPGVRQSIRAYSRCRHQDAPTPPSPLVGEGGRGDEGKKGVRMHKTPSAPEKTLPLRGRPQGGAPTCRFHRAPTGGRPYLPIPSGAHRGALLPADSIGRPQGGAPTMPILRMGVHQGRPYLPIPSGTHRGAPLRPAPLRGRPQGGAPTLAMTCLGAHTGGTYVGDIRRAHTMHAP